MKETLLEHYLNMLYLHNQADLYVEIVEKIKADGYVVCRNGYGFHRVIRGEE